MHTFAQKLKATQKTTLPARAHFAQNRELNSILHLQRTMGNQALQRMLQTNSQEFEVGLTSKASPRIVHLTDK